MFDDGAADDGAFEATCRSHQPKLVISYGFDGASDVADLEDGEADLVRQRRLVEVDQDGEVMSTWVPADGAAADVAAAADGGAATAEPVRCQPNCWQCRPGVGRE